MVRTNAQATTATGANIRRWLIICLGLLLFTFSWKVSWNSIAIGLVVLVVIAQVFYARPTLRWPVWRPFVLAYLLFTAVCLLSLSWTANLREGWFQISKTLPLAIFPVLVAVQRNPLTQHEQRQLYFWTGLGLVSVLLYAYLNAWHEYRQAHDSKVFFSHELVWRTGRNAIDLSRTASILLLMTIWYGNRKWHQLSTQQRRMVLPFSLLWASILVILGSKLIIVMTLLLLLLLLAAEVRFASRRWIAEVLLLTIGVAVAASTLPSVRARFHRALKAEARTSYQWGKPLSHANKPVMYDELTVRLILWETGLKQVMQSPWLGYGIGDVVDVTEQDLKARGVSVIYLRMDQHNQILQSALTAGVLGLLALAWLLWQLLRAAWLRRNLLLGGIVLLLLSNLLFESVLARHFSIVFFALLPGLVLWSEPTSSVCSSPYPTTR